MLDSIRNQVSEGSGQATEGPAGNPTAHSSAVRETGGVSVAGSSPRRRPIPPKLYRIGEVVEYSGMSRQTIHNYTTMGLLHEIRWTEGGHRLYDESVFGRLDQIAEFKAASKSIEDIREIFEKMGLS
jgi:hypothetical protein